MLSNQNIFLKYSFFTLGFLFVYHWVSFVIFWFYYYNATHSVAIFFSESLTFVFIFTQKMKLLMEDLQKLTNGQITPSKYISYRTSFVETLSYFFTINRIYGSLFLANFFVMGLLSAIFTLYLVIPYQIEIGQRFFLFVIVFYSMLIIFVIHWHLAKCIYRIHRPGRWLFKLMITMHCKTGLLRVKIKLLSDLITFNVLQANRHYGLTYGRFGLISMIAFTKVCF